MHWTHWVWWLYAAVIDISLLGLLLDAYLGLRRLDDLTRGEWSEQRSSRHPQITVIVPALNEENGIEACLRSLIAQNYPALQIIAVDDRSTDSTGTIMERVAAEAPGRLRVLHITELPVRWLGKTHAMWKAASLASTEWLLFTDGDVVFSQDAIPRAVTYAEIQRADHVSVLPTFITKSAGERMMMGMFQLAIAAFRPWKAGDPNSRFAVGAGAFNMLRREAYERIGGLEALRLEVVEDMALAFRLKHSGFASRAPLAPGMVSVHWASGAMGIVRTLTKNSYAVTGFRWYLALTIVLLTLSFHVGPFVFVWFAPGLAKLGFAVALAVLFAFYAVFAGRGGVSPAYFFLHPIAGLLTAYTLLRSTVVTLATQAVDWRGTKYPLSELRRVNAQRAGN